MPQAGINLAAAATADAIPRANIELSGPMNVVGDKGYHSNEDMTTLKEWDVRSYISEPQRGRRKWKDDTEAQQAVYGNRRRIQSEHGKATVAAAGRVGGTQLRARL